MSKENLTPTPAENLAGRAWPEFIAMARTLNPEVGTEILKLDQVLRLGSGILPRDRLMFEIGFQFALYIAKKGLERDFIERN